MLKNVSINFRPDDHRSLEIIKKITELLSEKKIRTLLPDYEILHKNDLSRFISKESDFLNSPDLEIEIGGEGKYPYAARTFLENG